MGSIAIVLALLGAGIFTGRAAGASLGARYLMSMLFALAGSAALFAWALFAQ
ncbi:MAG: hypothetical protein GX774_13680 [Armatimonadetes bacterium]|nr:hypothetical protein [Armatimonadota bacterium]